jgi:hypothetical protein
MGLLAAAAATLLLGGSGVSVHSKHDLYVVTISPRPATAPVGVLHTWRLRLRNARGAAVTGARIRVDGDMPAHGHGLPTRPQVRSLGGGRYEVLGMKFQMGGRWYVEFRISGSAGSDVARVSFDLPG